MKRLSPRASRILTIFCQDEGRKLGSKQLFPEHVYLALLKEKDCIACKTIEHFGLSLVNFKNKMIEFLNETKNSPNLDEIPKSQRYKAMLDIAEIETQSCKNEYIGTEHLLLAGVREEGSVCERFFRFANVNISQIRSVISEIQKLKMSSFHLNDNRDLQNGQNSVDSLLSNLISDVFKGGVFAAFDEQKLNDSQNVQKNNDNNISINQSSSQKKNSVLTQYCRDLTKLAVENKNDPVVGRDKEIHRIIQILSRRLKNNPVLTGEPGVGKTAIIEGLAQHIAQGKVPSNLLSKRILSLDLTSVVAGTKFRGEFEERMKKILNELNSNKNIILFIDELHNIIGAGSPDGTMDASNIMKPALSRGEIQIIGATTTKEYTKYIEKDLALERRFQVVKVEEPNDEETQKILEGIKQKYEEYHHVIYNDDVIELIVKLSRRYIPEKVLPDKAIDVLDEAGASKKIQEEEKPSELIELENKIKSLIEEKKELVNQQDYETAAIIRDKVISLKEKLAQYFENWKQNQNMTKKRVTICDIEQIISEMTGIPITQLSSSETKRIIHLENELHNTVIGQNEAVSIISGAVRRAKSGISSPKHPLGSFVFLGPTGVGKTQLAKALAKYLFGNEESLIRIDMSDFMEKHNATRLVGAPPGYVGYEEGGVLTEKVRRHPYSVVLLDEIEKAHPDIFNLLLQVLEEGELSDNLGHCVNFRNTVIIMTSNAGARQITNEGKVGFGLNEDILSYEEIKSSAQKELKKLLSPELLNRIDDIIVFNTLTKDEIAKILQIQLKELENRLCDKGYSIEITKNAQNYLIENGYNPTMGARPMKRLIRKEIEDALATQILLNSDPNCKKIIIDFENEKLKIQLENSVTNLIKEGEVSPSLQPISKNDFLKSSFTTPSTTTV